MIKIPPAPSNTHSNTAFYISIAFVTILLWASSFVSIRYSVAYYHPGSLALLRYLAASLCMLSIYFFIPNKTVFSLKQLGIAIFCGFLGIGIYNITLNYGETVVSAGLASFTIAQGPVVATLLAIIFLGETFSLQSILGLVISIFGVLLIALNAQAHPLAYHHHQLSLTQGFLLMIIAILSMSIYSILQKPLINNVNPMQFVCYAIWGGTLIFLPFSHQLSADFHKAPLIATANGIYLGLFPGCIAYFLWSFLLSKISVKKACSFLYAMPILTLLLGWIFLHEMPKLMAIVGGLIALCGAYLVNKK